MSHAHGHHLLPEQIARLHDIDVEEVVEFCLDNSVPIYHGRIDKALFAACWKAAASSA